MIDSMESASTWRVQSTTNKQGSGEGKIQYPETAYGDEYYTGAITENMRPEEYLSFREREIQEKMRSNYEERLAFGVAKEQARKDLPVSNYTEMYGKCDLKNLLHFMGLRSDGHAQLEIRLYSNIICGIVKELFPITFEAWADYQFGAVSFSRQEIQLLNYELYLQNPENEVESCDDPLWVKAQSMGMSKREFSEYETKLLINELSDFSLNNIPLYEKEE